MLPENFIYPYAAIGFSDFWKRWHVTLSAWLRDYLYIEIGGNRKGRVRTYVNLMITMLLGGLWHGANWTFVVWGALHGFYLCVEKFITDLWKRKKLPALVPLEIARKNEVVTQGVAAPGYLSFRRYAPFLIALFTFFLVNVTWVFFRAEDFPTAWRMLSSMFGGVDNGVKILTNVELYKIGGLTICLVAFHWMMRNTRVLNVAYKMKWWMVGIIWFVLLGLLFLSQESSSSFIYFQF